MGYVKRDPKWPPSVMSCRAPEEGQIILSPSRRKPPNIWPKHSREKKTLFFSAIQRGGSPPHGHLMPTHSSRPTTIGFWSARSSFRGRKPHRSNVVINYDIPWNPTRLIQRVGRVNRVDTHFDAIYTYNFFPTEEGNDAIKLRESAEARIHAFIEMLGADARLLTEGEEVKSHDLFAKLTSKKIITGEDEDEESELEYLAEIRTVRDQQPELFARIKRLPKKARSTRTGLAVQDAVALRFPSLLTYFRQGNLDKFYLAAQDSAGAVELDFLTTVKVLKPADPAEKRQTIPPDFYGLLDRNKDAFAAATSPRMTTPFRATRAERTTPTS